LAGLAFGVGAADVLAFVAGVAVGLFELVVVGVISEVCVPGVASGLVVDDVSSLNVSSTGDAVVCGVPELWFVLLHALVLSNTINMNRRDNVLTKTCFFNVLVYLS